MSIKAKLLITISVLLVFAFTAIGVVTVRVTESRMIDRVDDTLAQAPVGVAHLSVSGDEGPSLSRSETATVFMSPEAGIVHAQPSGYPAEPDPLPFIDPDRLAARAGEIYTTEAVDDSGTEFRVLVTQVGRNEYVAVAAPLDGVQETIQNLTMIIVVTGLSVLAVVILIVWITIQRCLRPIDDMVASAGLIASGDLSHRVNHDDEATEVGQLGQALNDMLAQIETSFAAKEASEQRLRQFVADASHELRTPLTSIRGYAELFRSGAAADPEGLATVMARIESEGARMSKLVEDLLLLARLDQGRPLQREPVDLVTLVADAVMDARVIDPARPITMDHPPEAYVLGDSDRLRQVIDNLLTNARVHTDPDTPVHVRVQHDTPNVLLSVSDDGPGIPPEAATRVFDRFYRADPSRTRSSGGSGLGLAIVASITEAHGGDVSLDTAPDEGTTVTVALPAVLPLSTRFQRELAGTRE